MPLNPQKLGKNRIETRGYGNLLRNKGGFSEEELLFNFVKQQHRT
jgi:hypothetical protein